MKITHGFNIPDKVTFVQHDVEVLHPTSAHASTTIDDIVVSVSAFPSGKSVPETIVLSVFIDGEQHVVFSGTKDKAKEFFSKTFPKN